MKRLISAFFLLIFLTNSLIFPVFSEDDTLSVGYVKALFTNYTEIENIKPIKVEVMNVNGQIYANAIQIFSRLGYSIEENDNTLCVYHNDRNTDMPYSISIFYNNSTTVDKLVFNTTLKYTSPYKVIKRDGIWWVPFNWSLELLDSSMYIVDDYVIIKIPKDNLISIIWDISNKYKDITFDWSQMGYTETTGSILGKANRLINLFNGVLSLDISSIASVFTETFGNTYITDSKYGKMLSSFICNCSESELDEVLETSGNIGEVIGNVLDITQAGRKKEYDVAKPIIDNFLEEYSQAILKDSNYHKYDKTYQIIKNDYSKYTKMKRKSDRIGTGTDIACLALGVISDVSSALSMNPIMKRALNDVIKRNEWEYIPEGTRNALRDYSSKYNGLMSGSISAVMGIIDWKVGDYSIAKIAKSSLKSAGVLVGWNIGTFILPFVEDEIGIEDPFSSAMQFELATYSTILQFDVYSDYSKNINMAIDKVSNGITPSRQLLKNIINDLIIYLKSALVAREVAIESVKNYVQDYFLEEQYEKISIITHFISMILYNMCYDEETSEIIYNFGLLPDESKIIADFESVVSLSLLENNIINFGDRIQIVQPTEDEWKELEERIVDFSYMSSGKYNYETDDAFSSMLYYQGNIFMAPRNYDEIKKYIDKPLKEEYYVDWLEENFYYCSWQVCVIGETDPLDLFNIPTDIKDSNGNIKWEYFYNQYYANRKNTSGYWKTSAKYLEWLVEDVFNGELNGDLKYYSWEGLNETLYYYDGFYYNPCKEADIGSMSATKVSIMENISLDDGRYYITYNSYIGEDYFGGPNYAIVALKENDDGFRFWSVYEYGTLE